jgi:hypothetical protein
LWSRHGALDESSRETELAAELSFTRGHLAVVGLMVETGEMEEPVEEKDLYFVAQGVAVNSGLTCGGFE